MVLARPRTEPPKADIHAALYDWVCYECKRRSPEGSKFAWLYNPYKEPGERDFKVHPEHWHDAEWEFFDQQAKQEESVLLEEPPLVIHESHSFKWAVKRMHNDGHVRRRNWDDRYKRLRFEYVFDLPVTMVITKGSQHIYSYPKSDLQADDWELC